MNKTFKKLISTLLIVLCIFNFLYSNYTPVYASTAGTITSGGLKAIVNTMTNLLGGVAGILTLIPRIIAMGIGLGINILTAQVAYMDGTTKGADVDILENIVITPFEIFFNKIQILDVNFLDFSIKDGTTKVFRTAVAEWYYIMRLISVSILLLILIYVGIRMAISTVASEKAMYKKTLVDWFTSLALVFLLQYIIMFTVHANSAIIAALEKVVKATDIEEKIFGIALLSLGISLESMASTVVYVIFVIQVLLFLLKYLKRMLTVAFLIIISPLISITYSIDKMGDGKAQALNTWLKEFVYNILIQPFHCIIYMAFIGTAFNLLSGGGDSVLKGIAQLIPGFGTSDLANAVLAIMCMMFVDDAEKIVKKIFGFDAASSLGSTLSTLAVAGAIGKGGQTAVNAAKGLRQTINTAKDKGVFASVRKDMINFKDRKEIAKEAKKYEAEGTEPKLAKQKAQEKNYERVLGEKASAKASKLQKKEDKKVEKAMTEKYGQEKINEMKANGTFNDKKEDFEKNEYKSFKEKRKGKISRCVGSIKNSNVGKYYRDNGAALGLATFAGIAGGMANPLAGVTAATAMYKGSSEFFKSSKRYLINDAKKHTDGNTNFSEIDQNNKNGDYEEGSKKMENLLNEIKDALRNTGKIENKDISKKAAEIKLNIEREEKMHPDTFDMNKILRESLGDELAGDENIRKSAINYRSFEREREVAGIISKGTELGMSISDFSGGLQSTIIEKRTVTTENIITHLNSNEDVTEIINKVDEKNVEEVCDRIKEVVAQAQKPDSNIYQSQIDKYNEAITKLQSRI